jgi:hypothetical protein
MERKHKKCPIYAIFQIYDNNDRIILFGYDKDSSTQFSNLFRLTYQGDIVWIAELPGVIGKDMYVNVKLVDDRLEANTWSGMWVRIDLSNGSILESSFTK